MKGVKLLATGSAMVCAIMLSSVPAFAQDKPNASSQANSAKNQDAGEIIVTARKRDETLISVPVAVTALSAASVNRYASNDLSKIGLLVPQASFEKAGGGGNGAIFTIRGIGSSPQDAGIEQSVSVNVDGVQISRGRVGTLSFFDLDRVEVLKGPQALFFGKNSPAGVISITTAGATPTLQASMRVGYEFVAREPSIEGAISGPISSTLGFRLAFRARKMEGWSINTATGGPNIFLPNDPLPGPKYRRDPRERQIAGRFTLEWKPTDDFSATLKVFADRDRADTDEVVETLCLGAHPTTAGVPDPDGDCKLDGRRSNGNWPVGRAYPGTNGGVPFSLTRAILTSLNMNYKSDNFKIASITSYYKYKYSSFDNFDWTRYALIGGIPGIDNADSFSQELRLSSDFDGGINFVAGGYFETNTRFNATDSQFGPYPPDPTTGRTDTVAREATNSGKVYSAFGQVIWNISPQVELAGGARFTRETKKSQQQNTYLNAYNPFPPGAFVPVGVVLSGKYAKNNVSPEATLTWHPQRDRTIYVAYKTGYKSGGFSNPSILTADFGLPGALVIKPEKTRGGELGAKGQFLDGRLTLTSALYRYTFRDLQLTAFNAQTISFSVKNAGRARTTGIEGEASYRATDELSLRGSFGYNVAKYTSYPGAPCQASAPTCAGTQDLSGKPLPRAPRWTVAGGFTYDHSVSDDLVVGFTGDVSYRSGYFAAENEALLSRQSKFALVNGSIRVAKKDNSWELSLIGRNLTNKFYMVFATDKPGGGAYEEAGVPARPREVLVQASVRF